MEPLGQENTEEPGERNGVEFTGQTGLFGQPLTGFREAALPLMEWLSRNCHPHMKAILDSEHAELMEGVIGEPRVFKS